jgi:hypothetical protein
VHHEQATGSTPSLIILAQSMSQVNYFLTFLKGATFVSDIQQGVSLLHIFIAPPDIISLKTVFPHEGLGLGLGMVVES